MKPFLSLCLLAIFAAACGDTVTGTGGNGTGGEGASGPGSGGNGAGSSFTEPRGVCGFDERVGRFSVEKQSDFGVVQGAVADGVVPTSIPEIVSDDGTCQLLKRRSLFCTPACVGAETCGEDGECVPYPRQISVGSVVINGLTKTTEMEPQEPGNTYFAPDADNPPYAVSSEIVLSAAGDEGHGPFTLFGVGSQPLAKSPTWALSEGQDLEIAWSAGSVAAAKIAVELTIDQHGTSPLSLLCVFDDTGTATVPTAVIDQLISSGVSGFPNGRIIRRTVDKVDIDVGCVELVVGSPLSATVDVVGFTPCNSPDDCTPPETCNLALELCE